MDRVLGARGGRAGRLSSSRRTRGEVGAALEPYGWHLVPEDLDERPWRRLLVKVADDRRVAHLHLLRPTDERWAQQLAFRDHLRRRPDVAARYADLKRHLAALHRDDRERYTEAKGDFVRGALADARADSARAPTDGSDR